MGSQRQELDLAKLADRVFSSPQVKGTYVHDILQALSGFPPDYMAHRGKIIAEVGALRKRRGQTVPITLEQTVQGTFEDYCGASERFRRYWDLFCWPS